MMGPLVLFVGLLVILWLERLESTKGEGLIGVGIWVYWAGFLLGIFAN